MASRPFTFLAYAFKADDLLAFRAGVEEINSHCSCCETVCERITGIGHAGKNGQSSNDKHRSGSHDRSFRWVIIGW